jgi:hypothetical protein
MIGQVWVMDYDKEHVLVIREGRRDCNYKPFIEYVVVIDSRGEEQIYSKAYFKTIATKVEDIFCP